MKLGPDQVERFINSISRIHPGFTNMFMEGHCWDFALVLRELFPGGELYYNRSTEGHIYYKWQGAWYDIRGKHLKCPPGAIPYNPKDGQPAWHWTRESQWEIGRKTNRKAKIILPVLQLRVGRKRKA